MQVKAQGLLNAAKWIEEEYGRDGLASVVRACSEPVRDRYVSAIAINWHPVEEFIEFVSTADRILARGQGKLAEEIGAAGARANTKGTLVRIAFYIAKPEFFFRRVAGLWHQFNDEGQMLVHHLDDHSGLMEVSGLKTPNATFCAVLTGWTKQIAIALGIENPTAHHSECRARGEARCMWEVRWMSTEADEKSQRGAGSARGSERRALKPSAPPPFSSTKIPAGHPSATRSSVPKAPVSGKPKSEK